MYRSGLQGVLLVSMALVALGPAFAQQSDPTQQGDRRTVLARDEFEENLTLSWDVRGHDPTHVSLAKRPGELTITTQAGGIYEGPAGIKNLYLTPVPAEPGQDFEVTTCLNSFRPQADFNQAGIIFFDDDDNYLKFVLEWNAGKGGRVYTVIRETDGQAAPGTHIAAAAARRTWLRVTKSGRTYSFSTSTDGTRFKLHRTQLWGDGQPQRVGLVAKNGDGSGAAEIDAAFEFFEVTRAADEQVESDSRFAFFNLPLSELNFLEGSLPSSDAPNNNRRWFRNWSLAQFLQPYAVLAGEGEAYIHVQGRTAQRVPAESSLIAIRVPRGEPVRGKLYFPNQDNDGLVGLPFDVPAVKAAHRHQTIFQRAKLSFYENLQTRDLPGAAWFRHQANLAHSQLNSRVAGREIRQPRRGRGNESQLTQTFALFSGGRAVSENLQLDRDLILRQDEGTVPLSEITGITVAEMDWAALTEGLVAEFDPLAKYLPADQHAVFFASFADAVRVADEVANQGNFVLTLAEPRSQSANTFERYQRQLGLSLDGLTRLLGPHVAKSVVLTGSDPYFRTGTDVAVLIESPHPTTLKQLLRAQIEIAARGNAAVQREPGQVGGLKYVGFVAPDRSLCSYLASFDDNVVVTNSLHQLRQFSAVLEGQQPPITALPEFRFFRGRYPSGAAGESAFIFVSDATIRRWCGPRWRIATSRRTRDAAVLAAIQAAKMESFVKATVEPGPMDTDWALSDRQALELTKTGVRSDIQGGLDFMTPIAELPLETVSRAEADAYRRWRDGYQRNWRWAFDPIGLRLGFKDRMLTADLSIMPLIWGSRYRQFVELSEDVELAPHSADPHGALAHAVLAINKKSPAFARAGGMVRAFAAGLGVSPLAWLGDAVGVYLDDDPVVDEILNLSPDEIRTAAQERLGRLPIALHAEVADGFKLTAFLVALRSWVEQSAPGMTVWETRKHNDLPYVRVAPSQMAVAQQEQFANVAIYYAASGAQWVVTLSEDVLKRALDRRADLEVAGGKTEHPWLGKNAAIQVKQKALQLAASLSRDVYQSRMQERAWSNLPILNEWKRRFPDQDPVELHQRIWHRRLICPGGGKYAWNEQWQTMESTVYGHPGDPRRGPDVPPLVASLAEGDFGLTFANQGLRTVVRLEQLAQPDKQKVSVKID